MNRYRKGRDWEYQVKRRLQYAGWLVFRCAGSKPVDLIAFGEGEIPLWVECKVGRRPRSARSLAIERDAIACGARYLLCVKKSNPKRRKS